MGIHAVHCEPSPDVSVSIHDKGIVFFQAGHGQIFLSNRAGAFIWQQLEQGCAIERIAEDISRRFRISIDTAHMHTMRFIDALERGRLIARRAA